MRATEWACTRDANTSRCKSYCCRSCEEKNAFELSTCGVDAWLVAEKDGESASESSHGSSSRSSLTLYRGPRSLDIRLNKNKSPSRCDVKRQSSFFAAKATQFTRATHQTLFVRFLFGPPRALSDPHACATAAAASSCWLCETRWNTKLFRRRVDVLQRNVVLSAE